MMKISNLNQRGKAQRAFDRAKNKIREQMPTKDFNHLEQLSCLDYLVAEGNRIGEELGTKAISGPAQRISELAFRIELFSSILQGFCKLAPMGGDLIWGIVSFLLMRARSNWTILEEVLEFFVGMAEDIKHLRLVKDTFSRESNFISPTLEAVYVAIINFWVKTMEYYMDKLKSDIISRIKTWFASSSALSDEFAKLKGKIAAQKTKLHELEVSLHHAGDIAERFRRQQKELADFISPPDYEYHFRAAKRLRHDGTCEWLRNKQKYLEWADSEMSRLLVIVGTAGVGKTILSSWLVENIRPPPNKQSVTIYHFFNETDDSRNTALAATRSLLDQLYNFLLSSGHPLLELFESELLGLSQKTHAHFEPLWNVFSSILSKYSNRPHQENTFAITIILDAMDECKDFKELVQSLRRLLLAGSNNIYIVVTGRPGNYVDESLRPYVDQATSTILDVTQQDVERDIAAFVQSSIGEIDRFCDPKLFHLRDSIVAEFSDTKNHQGMFLWAYLMCQEVRRPLSKTQITNLLKDLPKGLNGTYARICKRLSSSNETNPEFSRYVLQWVVSSRRPMTFAELEEALKLTTNDDGVLLAKDFCDGNGNLLWSRRDIVKACGDLVRYSGLDEGDTIGIIHLSAQQFLSTSSLKLFQDTLGDPAATEPFLVDVSSMRLKMAMICVKYLLSTSPHSKEYYSLPLLMYRGRTASQSTFKERHPLFEYATMYWAEYATAAIQSQPDVEQLLGTITEFARSSASTIWLEEIIHMTYIEYAQHTVQRLITLGNSLTSPILDWLKMVITVLIDFSSTLSSDPRVVRLCISHLGLLPSDRSIATPLEANWHRHWIHYDPKTDNLFSVDDFPPALKCQSLRTGIRSRPTLATSDGIPDDMFAHFDSAAVSPSTTYIAARYLCNHIGPPTDYDDGYLVLCWSINHFSTNSSIDDWATLVLSEFTPIGECTICTSPFVQFFRDNTILTPRGMFNLQTRQYIDIPHVVHDSSLQLKFDNILLSGDGRRVARTRDGMLEVLDVEGASVYQHNYDDLPSIQLKGFSHSGCKVVIYVDGLQLLCIAVDQAQQIDMSLSHGGSATWPDEHRAIFTADEKRFVARTTDGELAVWTFVREGDGSYRDHADMAYVFDLHNLDFVFDLVPGALNSSEAALIVEIGGDIIKRPLDLEQLPDKEEAYMVGWPVTLVSTKRSVAELSTWSIWKSNSLQSLRFERWMLELPHPLLISQSELPILLDDRQSLIGCSPEGGYLATHQAIIDTRATQNGFGVCELELPEVARATFNADETLFACLCVDEYKRTLYVFDISRGPEITQRASLALDSEVEPWSWLVFRNVYSPPSNLLAVGNCIMKLESCHLVLVTRIDKQIMGFSECGSYYIDEEGKLYRLPDDLVPDVSPPMNVGHIPVRGCYVHPPNQIHLYLNSGLVCLTYSGNNDVRRVRILWVIPDALREKHVPIYLIWPKEDILTMKLLIVLDKGPALIDTGIQRGDLMKEFERIQ